MQILAPADPRSTDKQNTDKAVVELKRISRDFNIPVIGISSFNRDSYSEPVSMKAFKESGAIEYTSDVLIGLQYTGMDYEMYTVVRNNGEEVRWETEKDSRRYQRIKDLFKENEVNAKAGDGISIDVKVLKNRSGAKGTQVLTYYPKFNCYREE
jgi:replicative DNA helicase